MLWNISLKLKHVGKIKQLFGDKKIIQPHSVHLPPPFCWGGGGGGGGVWISYQIFKKGGLIGPPFLEESRWKRGDFF